MPQGISWVVMILLSKLNCFTAENEVKVEEIREIPASLLIGMFLNPRKKIVSFKFVWICCTVFAMMINCSSDRLMGRQISVKDPVSQVP